MASSQVQFSVSELSIISIPPESYKFFYHGIVKLILANWEDDYCDLCNFSNQTFKSRISATSMSSIAANIKESHSTELPAAHQSSSIARHSNPEMEDFDSNDTNNEDDNEDDENEDDDEDKRYKLLRKHITDLKEFLNVSITPVECTVILPTELVDLLFREALENHPSTVLQDRYLAIQISTDGAGGQPDFLEIVAPLSDAKIPIFFIPTYLSNYVLVPHHARDKVTETLKSRGFTFSKTTNSYVGQTGTESPIFTSPSNYIDELVSHVDRSYSTTPLRHNSVSSTESSNSNGSCGGNRSSVPLSPSLTALGKETIETFRHNSVHPKINLETKLILTAVRNISSSGHHFLHDSPVLDKNEGHFGHKAKERVHRDKIYYTIIEILLDPPDFFTVTIVDGKELSIIFDADTASLFESEKLYGSDTDYIIPISFDLSKLPEDSTGIVAGVASQLYAYKPNDDFGDSDNSFIEMSYLSTAKSGVVMVPQNTIALAIAALAVFSDSSNPQSHSSAYTNSCENKSSHSINNSDLYYESDNSSDSDKVLNNEILSDSEDGYATSNASELNRQSRNSSSSSREDQLEISSLNRLVKDTSKLTVSTDSNISELYEDSSINRNDILD